MDDRKIQFLYASITDSQSIVRAIDTKIGFLSAVLLIPLTKIGKISNYLISLYPHDGYLCLKAIYIILIGAFGLTWFLSLICAIRAVIAIDNPAKHIVNNDGHAGSFYSGGLYELTFFDSLFNRKTVTAKRDVKRHIEFLPQDANKIVEELAFEQMKISYIRDIKITRQKWAFKFTFLWLIIGFIIYGALIYNSIINNVPF